MKIIHLLLLIGCILMAPVLIARSEPGVRRAGERAPALTCKTPSGEPMAWKDFEGRVVILYFHSARTRNAEQALEQLRASLVAAKELEEQCSVLLIVEDADAGQAARKALATSGFDIRVGLSKQHELLKSFGVVAYPTAFVIDRDTKIVDSVRGYGTLFSFHALTACRFALGLIDREAYDQLISGKVRAPKPESFTKSRKYMMARRLISTGKGEAALSILVGFAGETPPKPRLIALVAHLQLQAGDADAARPWIEQLAELEPEELDTTLLQARLQLAAGDPDGARSRLRGLDALDPRVEFVRGLILEREGRFEDAASIFRDALSTSLFLPE